MQDTEAIVARFRDLPQLREVILKHLDNNSSDSTGSKRIYSMPKQDDSTDSSHEAKKDMGQGFVEACCWALRNVKGLHFLHLESRNDRAILYRWGPTSPTCSFWVSTSTAVPTYLSNLSKSICGCGKKQSRWSPFRHIKFMTETCVALLVLCEFQPVTPFLIHAMLLQLPNSLISKRS